MTRISVDGNDLVIDVLGLDKVLALRGTLRFPLTSIVRYGPGDLEAEQKPRLRLGGTSVPGFLAGTFGDTFGGPYSFWEVGDFSKSIVIYLRDNTYEKAVVEVENVNATLHLIAAALP